MKLIYSLLFALIAILSVAFSTRSYAQSPDFAVYGMPVSETVVAGQNAQYAINFTPNGNTVAPSGAYTGSIVLTVSGLPANATATFNTVTITGTQSSTVTIATSTSTPTGSYTLTIAGASGTLAHTTTVALTVVASASAESAAQQVVNSMTQDQEISEIAGTFVTNEYFETVLGLSSLGIPTFDVLDGPLGPAGGAPGHCGNAIAPPAPIALAATFDPSAAFTFGTTVGFQERYMGNALVHGPDVNISRVPECGRTFEALGEDPYLAGQIVAQDILGIQSKDVIAEVKHYAGNNQETDRSGVDDIIDERTEHEIYLPHFQAAIQQGQAGAVMCAYTSVNGYPSCGSAPLLTGFLKHDWGFPGLVESDYPATGTLSAMAGEDLEMPSAINFTSAILDPLVTAGTMPKAVIDDKLIRRFSQMMLYNSYPTPPTNQCSNPAACVIDPTSAATVESQVLPIAEESSVLLKNNGVLPFKLANIKSIAMIGPGTTAGYEEGGGSATVNPAFVEWPQAGVQARVGTGVTVTTNDGGNLSSAVSLAQSSSVVILVVACPEQEGTDLTTLDLPTITEADGAVNQDNLITSIVAANPNTVIVLNNGSPVTMPWLSSAPAILEMWYPGSMEGYAMAALLFGDYNPSGHLPLTFMVNESDEPANTAAQYPGINNVAQYSEGVFIGYRHYDHANLAVNFPFGFGLSYTTFGFSGLSITPTTTSYSNNPNQTVTVSFTVKNTGSVSGADVAQVYVGMPNPSSSIIQPPKQLKGFQRVSLTAGQSTVVNITLNQSSFSYWDVNSHAWQVASGTYQIMVGDSSRNIYLTGTVTINAVVTAAPGSLTATSGYSQNILNWTPSVGATSYNVYRGTASGGEGGSPIATGITGPIYVDTAVAVGTRYYYKVAAVDSAGTSAMSNEASAIPIQYTPPPSETPYGGTPWPVPGTIQAENYDLGGQGIGYSSATTTNGGGQYRTDGVGIETTQDTGGGYDVGWTNAGEWLNFTVNVATAGTYTVGFRVATNGAGTVVDLRTPIGTALTGPVTLPSTGGYQAWTTVNATCTLQAGLQVIQLYFDTAGYNINYFTLSNGSPMPPGTPTNLTASAGNAQVSLAWTAGSGATSYNVYRSTTSGAEGTTALVSGISTFSYTDAGLTNGTTYYYKVAAVNSVGTSAQSNEASATPVAGSSGSGISINCGGVASSPFVADTDFAGGTANTVSATIDTSLLTAPVPAQTVLQSNRFGPFTYTIPNLTAGSSYNVTLYFAETYWTAAAKRVFNVTINGTQVLTNFDIFAAAGAVNKAVQKSFTATANASGQIVITTVNVTDNAQINAIVVGAGTPPPPTGISINCGGAASGAWVADTDFAAGGGTQTVTNTIDTSLLIGTNPPQAVLQSNRYNAPIYTIPGFVAGSSHIVTLYYAEEYQTAAGKRVMNVIINGTQVLTSFDIFATAGAEFKAVQKTLTATANSAGQIIISETNVTDNAQINGISIN